MNATIRSFAVRGAAALLAAVIFAPAAHAAGPLIVTDESGQLKPLVWDTSRGPVPVYTDGGGAFTYDFDGVTPFITIERANEITAESFRQWSQVTTSTFRATIAGTIAERTGIADVTGASANNFYGVENGYGFWVLYDTDGSIIEEFFGAPRDAVLGIAFPEISDGAGQIIEATAVMNGWAVSVDDPHGDSTAGVFTHEFGHALNLSHSQVNGQMAYFSFPGFPLFPGPPQCGLQPVHRYDLFPENGVNPADPAIIETMFPFIDSRGRGGVEQSTVDRPDDIAGISNLYPTAAYLSGRGSISGVLRLKDGRTPYSGINIIARNVANPLLDAVSAMSGDQTQGQAGPDGRFTIRNLTPGQRYVVYIEAILAGGYPTTPQLLFSEGEYWNASEGSNPLRDRACQPTAIPAVAGRAQAASITFNGFRNGVQFTPIVSAFLLDMSRNGNRASGLAQTTPFLWDKNTGIELLPEGLFASNGASTDRNGRRVLVQADPDGNGLFEPAIWSRDRPLVRLGSLNGETCGAGTNFGKDSASGWDMDDNAFFAVGTGYIDQDGDGNCEGPNGEIVPFIWDRWRGMRELPTSFSEPVPWVRANTITGNGLVALGTSNFQTAVAWVAGGPMINLGELVGARSADAADYWGFRIPLDSASPDGAPQGVVLWNAWRGTSPAAFTNIDSLRYCRDVPLLSFFGENLCAEKPPDFPNTPEAIVPLDVFGANDDGTVLVGRAGSFFTGFFGAIWIEGIGWQTISKFLHEQGVVEADAVPFDNPTAISGKGGDIVGGQAGRQFSWLIDADQVFVCHRGRSQATRFPLGTSNAIRHGARLGRCEYIG